MLTPKQKRDLKALASTLTIRYQIGKNEISDTLIDMLNKALTAHELIKIDVMKGCSLPIMEVALDIANKLNAELVHVMGRVIIIFRRNKMITLPMTCTISALSLFETSIATSIIGREQPFMTSILINSWAIKALSNIEIKVSEISFLPIW